MDFRHRGIFMVYNFWHPLFRKWPENDGNYPRWIPVYTQYSFFHELPPVVCEFSSPQISCESDIYMLSFKSCHCIMIRSLCVSLRDGRRARYLSRSVIVHLQWQYLKWCNNQSSTELLITVSFRPINVFTTQLSLAWAAYWTPKIINCNLFWDY